MIERTPFVEQDDGSLVCTLRIPKEAVEQFLSQGLTTARVTPLRSDVGATQVIAPDSVRVWGDTPINVSAQSQQPAAQVVGVTGVDGFEPMMLHVGAQSSISLAALAKHAPFQRFVEEMFGQSEDSLAQAVGVLRRFSVEDDLRRFLIDYERWHARQVFAKENPFPDK